MEVNHLLDIIKGCYKKLKGYVYYSKNLIHLKYKIINFENKRNFENTFSELAKAIVNNDDAYFDKLIKKINWIPQIKKIESADNNISGIVSNYQDISANIVIGKINFFIDMPIELYILDTFWTILFGKTLLDLNRKSNYVKANEFAYGLYKEEKGLAGINFDTLDLYKPYFYNYKSWKNGAINMVSSLYKDKKDSTIISLDLTGYFYSIDISKNIIKEIYEIVNQFNYDYKFETKVILNIYREYSEKIKKIKPDIKNNNVLPIGMISSGVISSFYLYSFDEEIAGNSEPKVLYYSRYVDDILIVIPEIIKCNSAVDMLKKCFSNSFDFDLEKDEISLKLFPSCTIQNSKIKIIQNSKNGSRSLIDSLKDGISTPSEVNMLPNIENSELDNFLLDVYNRKTDSFKIRDNDGLELNKYKLMKFMGSYVKAKKNTIPSGHSKKDKYGQMDDDIFKQLDLFFNSSNLFLLWDRWEKIFEFVYLNETTPFLAMNILSRIRDNISKITVNDEKINQKEINNICKKIEKNLFNNLIYSVASVFALRPFYKTSNEVLNKANSLLNRIRKANLLNHNLVGLPLVNYLNNHIVKTKDLFNMQESDIKKAPFNDNFFDRRKIEYSPRFIHFGEYMLCRNLLSISELNEENFAEKIQEEYKTIFKKNMNFYDVKRESFYDDSYLLSTVKIANSSPDVKLDEIYIALGNVDLNKHVLIKDNKINLDGYKTIANKMSLFRMLDACVWYPRVRHLAQKNGQMFYRMVKEMKYVNFVVFPELYIPFEWLNDVMLYSKRIGVGVITGVKYCKNDNKLINSVACIIPFRDEKKYRYSTIFMREKNDYAPHEKELLLYSKYSDPTKETSFNYIFEWNKIKFSILNCFELTDIKSRANLKSKVDIIFTPEYNRDIAYFSSIIESTSKDNGCFVVQVNSSNIGDTKIIAPFHSNYANICSISGGEKDSIHIGKINIDEYNEFKAYEKSKDYIDKIKQEYQKEAKKKKRKKKTEKKEPNYEKYKHSSARL